MRDPEFAEVFIAAVNAYAEAAWLCDAEPNLWDNYPERIAKLRTAAGKAAVAKYLEIYEK